jgi:hypothetical protein
MPLYSRKDMPQVNTQNLGKALGMTKRKAKVTKGMSLAVNLKQSQKELIKSKVKGVAAKYSKPTDMKPLIISKDNYIIDGHHRWAAAIYKFGKDVEIPTYTIHLKKDEAIELYNSVAKSLGENITVPIKVGDTVLGGKFKNKRIVVKSIGKNEKGDITINNKPLLKFRLIPKTEGWSNNYKKSIDCNNPKGFSQKAHCAGKKKRENVAPNHDGKSAPYGSGYKKKNEIYFDMFGNKCKNATTLDGRCIDKYHPSPTIREPLSEIPMADLQKIDKFADKKLNPVDVVITDKHFFDRLNDPRNDKEISSAELIGFFKRLAKKKKEFLSFLDKYNQVVASDDRTNINIPFMKQANKVIAKTVMRKKDFKTQNQKVEI